MSLSHPQQELAVSVVRQLTSIALFEFAQAF